LQLIIHANQLANQAVANWLVTITSLGHNTWCISHIYMLLRRMLLSRWWLWKSGDSWCTGRLNHFSLIQNMQRNTMLLT